MSAWRIPPVAVATYYCKLGVGNLLIMDLRISIDREAIV